MATANDIITRAFSRAGITPAGSSLEPDESQDGLSLFNDMMANWEPIYQFGFSPVAGLSDQVRVPRFANAAIIDALAIILSPEYHKPVTPELAAAAKLSLQNMKTANVGNKLSDVDMPSTLPIGTGNQCDNVDDARFFTQKDKANF